MRKDLGIVKSPEGMIFTAFWDTQSKRVYVKPSHSALLSALSNAGIAYTEDDALKTAQSYVLNTLFHWI